MKKITLLLCLGFLFVNAPRISAQIDQSVEYQAVILNYERSCFGDNKPLPLGKYFVINGAVRTDISYVEAILFSGGRMEKGRPLYQGSWRRSLGNNSAALFNIPMNHQLIGNTQYDVLIQYFRETTPQERSKLKSEIIKSLDWYADQSLEAVFARNSPDDRSQQMISDLNNIAKKAMAFYRNRQGINFKGFSDLSKGKLRQLMMAHPAAKSTGGIENATSARRRNLLTSEFKTLMHGEIESYLNVDLFILADRLPINNYPTERIVNAVGLNVGLGMLVIDASQSPMNTGIAPYIGISIPIANKSNSEILRTASVSGGLFLTSVRDGGGDIYKGPILSTPSYLALGIKPFRFIRLQVGASFVQQSITNATGGEEKKPISVKPMIGLALEFDFSFKNKNNLNNSAAKE
jgi:hypothetical protein